jgi:hypothetical protein
MKDFISKIKNLFKHNCNHNWYIYNIWEDSGYEYNNETIMIERTYKICDKCNKRILIK